MSEWNDYEYQDAPAIAWLDDKVHAAFGKLWLLEVTIRVALVPIVLPMYVYYYGWRW